jgi:aminoglycoside phosphotransferase (APT) family kinase protein
MSSGHRPPPEVEIDVALVRRLVAAQFPQWAALDVWLVDSQSWDNEVFHLGGDLAVRLPRRTMGARQAERQHRWLRLLAPRLPLPIPVPVGEGRPGHGYPWSWSVVPWFAGEIAALEPELDLGAAARDLAEFLHALRRIPGPGPPNPFRGIPLARRNDHVRLAISQLGGVVADTAPLLRIWQQALDVPEWAGPPRWFHGDLHPANVVALNGQVSAIIDFDHVGIGDPACDMMIAWTMLSDAERPEFRARLHIDDATWERGRGWALNLGVAALAFGGPQDLLATIARHALDELTIDAGRPVTWLSETAGPLRKFDKPI